MNTKLKLHFNKKDPNPFLHHFHKLKASMRALSSNTPQKTRN